MVVRVTGRLCVRCHILHEDDECWSKRRLHAVPQVIIFFGDKNYMVIFHLLVIRMIWP